MNSQMNKQMNRYIRYDIDPYIITCLTGKKTLCTSEPIRFCLVSIVGGTMYVCMYICVCVDLQYYISREEDLQGNHLVFGFYSVRGSRWCGVVWWMKRVGGDVDVCRVGIFWVSFILSWNFRDDLPRERDCNDYNSE